MLRALLEDEPGIADTFRPCSSVGIENTSFALFACYATLCVAAAVQRVRLSLRDGGSMQKLFHSLLVASSFVRALFFLLLATFSSEDYPGGDPLSAFLNILPDSLFFTKFCLLVMFWANIFHKARNRQPAFLKSVRRALKAINVVVWVVQLTFWAVLSFAVRNEQEFHEITMMFHIQVIVLCLMTTLGFIGYGGSLYFLLRRFPINSNDQRQRLLREVGWVTSICCLTWSVRAAMVLLFVIRQKYALVSFVVCGAYFAAVEVIPSALVLWILRLMPAPRVASPGGTSVYRRVVGAVSRRMARSHDGDDVREPLYFADPSPTASPSQTKSVQQRPVSTPPASSYRENIP